MICKYCGAELKEGAKFCVECGKPVEVENSTTKTDDANVKSTDDIVNNAFKDVNSTNGSQNYQNPAPDIQSTNAQSSSEGYSNPAYDNPGNSNPNYSHMTNPSPNQYGNLPSKKKHSKVIIIVLIIVAVCILLCAIISVAFGLFFKKHQSEILGDVNTTTSYNSDVDTTENTDDFESNSEDETQGEAFTQEEFSEDSQGASGNVSDDGEVLGIGDTWKIDGYWEFTITGIKEIDERNDYYKTNPNHVYEITYKVKNLGWKSDTTDSLDLCLSAANITDSKGNKGSYYYTTGNDILTFLKVGESGTGIESYAFDDEAPLTIKITGYTPDFSDQMSCTFVIKP